MTVRWIRTSELQAITKGAASIGIVCLFGLCQSSPVWAQQATPSQDYATCVAQRAPTRTSTLTWAVSPPFKRDETVSPAHEPIELWKALRRIVPKRLDLEVQVEPTRLYQTVLWCDGVAWPEALDLLLASLGMRALVTDQSISVVEGTLPADHPAAVPVPVPLPLPKVVPVAPPTPVAKAVPVTETAPVSRPVTAVATTADAAALLEPSPQHWDISAMDKTVRALVNRWSRLAGWQRVSWELPYDIQIGVTASIDGSFEQALETLAVSLMGTEWPIEFVLYDNHVVRVLKLQKGGQR